MQNAWGDFIEAAEPVIRQVQEPGNTVLAIEPLLRRLVARPDWLKEKYRRAIPSKAYSQYLLYRPADHAFSVVSFVWNPGQGSPIHDHCMKSFRLAFACRPMRTMSSGTASTSSSDVLKFTMHARKANFPFTTALDKNISPPSSIRERMSDVQAI